MATATTPTATISIVHDLRSRWKPHKERLNAVSDSHPTVVRFHRACSWMAQVEKIDLNELADEALIQQWIAFNALYGQWNGAKREPSPDRERWKKFLGEIIAIDRSRRLELVLVEHKRLALAIFENAFLNEHFWAEPSEESKARYRKGGYRAQSLYVEKRWQQIAEQLLDRVYLLRCQIMHGAASYNGKLNREATRHCAKMMWRILPAILEVWIDHGADTDWGPLCYPPMNGAMNGRLNGRGPAAPR